MTTINTVRYAAITLLFLLGGCSHRVPQATVEVIDTSLSITPRAEKAVLIDFAGRPPAEALIEDIFKRQPKLEAELAALARGF